jgi:hypothetical protein
MREHSEPTTRAIAMIALALAATVSVLTPRFAHGDESGTSFWLPGQFGSLAAVPTEPGWSLPLIYFYVSLDSDGGKAFERGRKITTGLDVRQDLLLVTPTYTLADPVLGGQLALSVTGVYGVADIGIDATLTGPRGAVASRSASDSLTGLGDLYPSATLRWNHDVHNTMVYTMLGVPVGRYRADRLANLGLNHWSVDAGGGYTYLHPKTGREFSITAGLTYNFENPDTDYRNGLNAHVDWGASQFLSEEVHVGFVGYFYHQLTGDSGAGATLGDFKSRVNGIGPQAGYLFKIGEKQAYLNLKGYWEFGAQNRPEGWNLWLTLSLPIGAGNK